jgi:hypothetical protein
VVSDADDALREAAQGVQYAGPRVAVPRGPPLFDDAHKVVAQAARYAENARNLFILGGVALAVVVALTVAEVAYFGEWGTDYLTLGISILATLVGGWSYTGAELSLRKLQALVRLVIRST